MNQTTCPPEELEKPPALAVTGDEQNRYTGQKGQKGKKGESKGSPKTFTDKELADMKAQDCRRWLFGGCKFGRRCRFAHDEAKKGTTNDKRQNRAGEGEQDLVVTCPVRIDIRFQGEKDEVPLVDFDKLTLPEGEQPAKGYHFFSDLTPTKLPALRLRAVWDGGAEGTTISQKAASKVLRAQSQLAAEDKVALVNPERFKAQTFYGFADTSGTKVDVKMPLRLNAPCGTQLPPLVVRVVPHQLDDLLVSAPDLDVLGWSRTPSAFVLSSVGISIPRTDNWSLLRPVNYDNGYFADAPSVARTLRCRQTVVVPAGSSMYVPVDGGDLVLENSWAVPCQECLNVGLGLPEGPIAPGQQMMA